MKPCGFCQKIPEKFFICLLVTCVFVYLLVVKAANCIYLLLETLINWLWNEQKPFILFFFKMNGYQMTVLENGLVKQEIKKRFVLLYAKGILIFLQWKLVLFTPMLLVRSTKNACGLIDLFLTSHALQVPEKLKQQKHNTKQELGRKCWPRMMLPMQRSCFVWKFLTGNSATIAAVTLLIYSSVCLETVK